MKNNLELEDMKMKNYELIALLMELPAGYDIKFVFPLSFFCFFCYFFVDTVLDIESKDIIQEIYILA